MHICFALHMEDSHSLVSTLRGHIIYQDHFHLQLFACFDFRDLEIRESDQMINQQMRGKKHYRSPKEC